MRRTKYAVVLSDEQRAQLRTLVGRGVAPARRLTHARILLKADQGEGGAGWGDAAIAGALEVHPATVARVRRQYVDRGPGGGAGAAAPRRGVRAQAGRGAGGAPGRPGLRRPARRGGSAGRCACWPTGWSALEVVDARLATRRCGRP